ncbi:DUF192 domain-containing protein [Aminobacterium sp. UBA5514]
MQKHPLSLLNAQGDFLFSPLFCADSFMSRFRGLMLCPPEKKCGLILIPCNSIHTFCMRFPLDIFFLNDECRILCVRWNLSPWRCSWCPGASMVVECPAGEIPHKRIEIGSKIIFKKISSS